jgi:hypothetical protein
VVQLRLRRRHARQAFGHVLGERQRDATARRGALDVRTRHLERARELRADAGGARLRGARLGDVTRRPDDAVHGLDALDRVLDRPPQRRHACAGARREHGGAVERDRAQLDREGVVEVARELRGALPEQRERLDALLDVPGAGELRLETSGRADVHAERHEGPSPRAPDLEHERDPAGDGLGVRRGETAARACRQRLDERSEIVVYGPAVGGLAPRAGEASPERGPALVAVREDAAAEDREREGGSVHRERREGERVGAARRERLVTRHEREVLLAERPVLSRRLALSSEALRERATVRGRLGTFIASPPKVVQSRCAPPDG